jgi:2-dehydro-3-deoxyglucarate aldolase/4-hydroxy-2-oxoheptanedioate aldolase
MAGAGHFIEKQGNRMKPNRFKQLLAEGKTAVGHMILEFGTRGMAQILDNAGLDFVIIDTEHSPFTTLDLADLVAWFKATPIAPFVRVPQVEYHLIARTMDLGALGIMAPNVRSGAEARALVQAAKYLPLGRRGVIMGNAHTDFKSVNPAEAMAAANQNSTIICQIESVEGMENLEAIAATPGVDVLWVGHFDLTNSQGIPGQFHHPLFLEAMQRVVESCHKHGLAAGIQPGNLAQAQEWMEMGFNAISYSGDFFVYAEAMKQGVAGVRKLAEKS